MSDRGVAVVVGDDAEIRQRLEAVLGQAGFDVICTAEGVEAVKIIRHEDPSVIIVDVNLPDSDGFEVLRQVRLFSRAYVVVLTASTEESDLLTSFHAGADDYVIKPFRPMELRARITAMLRRSRAGACRINPVLGIITPPPPETAPMRHNGLTLNPDTRSVTVKGESVNLTGGEFDILHQLLRRAGAVCTTADLDGRVTAVFDPEDAPVCESVQRSAQRSVQVHVRKLRRKLGDDPRKPHWLETVRGFGYKLAPSRSGIHG